MTSRPNFHESFTQDAEVKGGSNRSFGIVFSVVFGIVAFWPVLFSDGLPFWWALAVSLVFLALALVYPRSLTVPNRLWTKLGLLLHRIVNPIVMALIFFAVFTPMAVLIRLLGKDLLNVKIDDAADSYWIERDPPGPSPESMRRQY